MAAALLVVAAALAGGVAQSEACTDPVYRQLDFWIGEWTVTVGETIVGRDNVEKTLGGCAVLEHWTDARGSKGESLFYVDPTDGSWKQVWVTESGQVKEKDLVEQTSDGAVRFEGFVLTPQGRRADRTTLTPLADGRVRQVIEASADGGKTWTVAFDAIYSRTTSR